MKIFKRKCNVKLVDLFVLITATSNLNIHIYINMLLTHTVLPIQWSVSRTHSCQNFISNLANPWFCKNPVRLRRDNNVPSVLWNELSWTMILCPSNVWPLGSSKHGNHCGSQCHLSVFNCWLWFNLWYILYARCFAKRICCLWLVAIDRPLHWESQSNDDIILF